MIYCRVLVDGCWPVVVWLLVVDRCMLVIVCWLFVVESYMLDDGCLSLIVIC